MKVLVTGTEGYIGAVLTPLDHRRRRGESPLPESQAPMRAAPGQAGLYRAVGGQHVSQSEHALLWVLNQSDDGKDLLDIAQRSGIGFDVLADAAARLAATDRARRTARAKSWSC